MGGVQRAIPGAEEARQSSKRGGGEGPEADKYDLGPASCTCRSPSGSVEGCSSPSWPPARNGGPITTDPRSREAGQSCQRVESRFDELSAGGPESRPMALTAQDDVLLTANAGTGKTTTVVGKILWALGLERGRRDLTAPSIAPCPELSGSVPGGRDHVHGEGGLRPASQASGRSWPSREGGDALRWRLDEAYVGHHPRILCLPPPGSCTSFGNRSDLPDFRWAGSSGPSGGRHPGGSARGAPWRGMRTVRSSLPGGGGCTASTYQDGIVDLIRKMLRDLRWNREPFEELGQSTGAWKRGRLQDAL